MNPESDDAGPEPKRRGRLPAHERERREREILATAMAVIVESGEAAATMGDIADRAGASKETLYSWFGSREGLLTALIESNGDASAEAIHRAMEASPTDLAGARQVLVGYATGLLTLLTGEASVALNRAAMSSSSPSLAESLLRSGRHRIGPIVEGFLHRLDEHGIVDVPDPGKAFRMLYGLVVRDTQIRVLLGEPAPAPGEISEHAERAVDDFLRLLDG